MYKRSKNHIVIHRCGSYSRAVQILQNTKRDKVLLQISSGISRCVNNCNVRQPKKEIVKKIYHLMCKRKFSKIWI